MLERTYKVWISGRKEETQVVMQAPSKSAALVRLASCHGVKTFQCDGRWMREARP